MNLLKTFHLLSCIFTFTAISSAAIVTHEFISDPLVRSVSLRNPDNFMAPPIIRLGTGDRLVLNFDIIGDAHEYLRYCLIHCNADWQPSRLLESEYLDAFNEAVISDYAYSSNTYIHYVNYNLVIPDDQMSIITDGNYLLQVYDEDHPDEILLQTRFSVVAGTANIRPHLTTHTDNGFNTEWQQINLSVDVSALGNINPYQDLVVTVMQNNRPETTRTVTHPLRVDGNNVIFEHDRNLIFPASNEYRRFETVRADYPGMNIDSVSFDGRNWQAYLTTDTPRYDHNYIYDKTQHGRFKIDEYNATDPDLGADYVTVHFSLDSSEIIGADVYVDGDFNLHQFNDRNRMKYDHNTGQYTVSIPLKQGSYNYQYIALPRRSDKTTDCNTFTSDAIPADSGIIEGNHYETENEYLIKVYLRSPGNRADRLVGVAVI